MSAAHSSPPSPKRRWFLKTAVAVAVVGASVGGGIWWNRGIEGHALTADGREVFRAVARGVLGPVLPPAGAARDAVLDQYLTKLDALVASFPSAKRNEVSLLIGMLANSPTRYLTTGRWGSWAEATDEQVSQALEHLRSADNMVKNVSYEALRRLTCLAFFAIPDNWSRAGYPGPVTI